MQFPPGISTYTVLKADFTSKKAREELKPAAEALYRERVQNSARATERKERAATDLADIDSMIIFMQAQQPVLTKRYKDRKAGLEVEYHALRSDFALVEQAGALTDLFNAMRFNDAVLEEYRFVKRGAAEIVFLDAVENEAAAIYQEMCTAADVSWIKTIASLDTANQENGAELAVINPETERLRQAASAAHKRWEVAQHAARSARRAYDASIAARASQGLLGIGRV